MKKNSLCILLLILLFSFCLYGCSNGGFLIGTQYIEKNMYVGEKILLQANITEQDGNTIVWESSDPEVATVDQNGLVEALAEGYVNIIATLGDETCIAHIKIEAKEQKEKVEVHIEGKQTVLIDESIILKVVCDRKNESFTWSSSDDSIATVDQSGTVTGIKPGVVTINVTSVLDKTINDEIIVLVRTGDGIQDIITNYINNNTYITTGDYNLESINKKVVDLIKSVEKSVIGVSAYHNTSSGTGISYGTGGIYKKEKTNNGFKYYVFTNHHVIEDGDVIKVYLGDIDEYVVATVVKEDAKVDLALLTFEYSVEYEPLKLGTIGCVSTGDFVVAIGNPGSYTYYGTATFGMISCVSRKLDNIIYVQHDTPINPGNSGGPLFDLNGNVIGINTMKIVTSEVEGLGFSIAMEEFLKFFE